jgi:hypothetical protein
MRSCDAGAGCEKIDARSSNRGAAVSKKRASIVAAVLAMAILVVSVPAEAGAVQGAAEFYARGPSGNTSVSCAIYDGYGSVPATALCEHIARHSQSKATLRPNGSVVLCRTHSITSNRCGLGNVGENAATYGVGKTVTVGRFACTVRAAGVQCTVTASGKGFLLGPKQLRAVGGAAVTRR